MSGRKNTQGISQLQAGKTTDPHPPRPLPTPFLLQLWAGRSPLLSPGTDCSPVWRRVPLGTLCSMNSRGQGNEDPGGGGGHYTIQKPKHYLYPVSAFLAKNKLRAGMKCCPQHTHGKLKESFRDASSSR